MKSFLVHSRWRVQPGRARARQIFFWVLLAMLVSSGLARADQYRSEVREVAPPSTQTRAADPAELLKVTTEPYARSLLLRELAARAAEDKDYKKARNLLQEALSLNALSGPAAEMMKKDLAALTMATGQLKDQVKELEALVRSGNATPELLVALGAAYLENKNYRQAVGPLRKGISASKKPDPSWKQALVAALIGSGRESEAATILEELLRDNPDNRDSWLQLSALYLKGGNKERAQATMEISKRLGYLSSDQDRLRLVTLTGQVGAPFEAGSLLQGWLDAGVLRRNVANRKLLASLWVRARETALAIKILHELAAAHPSRKTYEQIAQLKLEREDYRGAVDAIRQSFQFGEPTGPLLMSLGLAQYQLADIDGAIDSFGNALAFEKQAAMAKDWIKYLESGRAREQALAAATEIQKRQSESIELSGRLLDGGSVSLAGSGPDGRGGAPAAAVTRTGRLTAVGAEEDGNADGTIPRWTGGIARSDWPAGFAPGQKLIDPYSGDGVLFTISRDNMSTHAAKLSEGHKALLKKYSGYRMPVYQTRRSVSYPKAIEDASKANQATAKLLGSDDLTGARLGFPFPRPESGVEAMWNHRVRFRGNTSKVKSRQLVIEKDGSQIHQITLTEQAYFRYANTLDPVDLSRQNILLYYLLQFTGSGRSNFVALVHETANSKKNARSVWVGPPRSARLFRVPPVGYDLHFPGTGGIYFVDMVDMYNGPFDRYVWKLLGKREMYLPYNSYRLASDDRQMEKLLGPKHLDPAVARYELHRVWVVEATERGGRKHSFGKRVFYLDEDSWNVVLVENHDREGHLWRFQEGHLLPFYDIQAANCMPVLTYDLKESRYFANRMLPGEPAPDFSSGMKKGDFSPGAVKARYLR